MSRSWDGVLSEHTLETPIMTPRLPSLKLAARSRKTPMMWTGVVLGWGCNGFLPDPVKGSPSSDTAVTTATVTGTDTDGGTSGTPGEWSELELPACPACDTVLSRDDKRATEGVRVDDHGAVGDGLHCDDAAIKSARDAAQDGGLVLFTGGRTYTVCQTVGMIDNQTWTRTGTGAAVVRRADAATSLLVEGVAKGDLSVRVTDPSAFELGMGIAVVRSDSPGGSADGEFVEHVIESIDGDRLVFRRGLVQGYEPGDTVVSSFPMIRMGVGSTLDGLDLDGNRAENDTYVAWQTHWTVLTADASTVTDCRFLEAQSDAISLHGEGVEVRANVFEHLNGSAIHLSASTASRIEDNTIRHTNEQYARVEHAEAAITWSTANTDVEIRNNCIRDGATLAFGMVNIANNHTIRLWDNQICRTEGLLYATGARDGDFGLEMRRNLAIEVGSTLVQSNTDEPVSGVAITDNVIVDGYLSLRDVIGVDIASNVLWMRDYERYGDTELSDHAQAGAITVRAGRELEVRDNLVVGGRKGIFIRDDVSDEGGVSTVVEGNQALGTSDLGFSFGYTKQLNESQDTIDMSGLEARDNVVSTTAQATDTPAVFILNGSHVAGMCVESNGEGVWMAGHEDPTILDSSEIYSSQTSVVWTAGYTESLILSDNVFSIAPAKDQAPGAQFSGTQVGSGSCPVDMERLSERLAWSAP